MEACGTAGQGRVGAAGSSGSGLLLLSREPEVVLQMLLLKLGHTSGIRNRSLFV